MIQRFPLVLALLCFLGLNGCESDRQPTKPDGGPAPATAAAPAAGKEGVPDARAVPAAAGVKEAAGTSPASSKVAFETGADATPVTLGPGASRLPSGIEYEVLKAGEGPSPALGSKVVVHFSATIDGGKKVLDTWPANVPREFKLDSRSLIRGWVDALVTMKKGERRKLKVPSQLAYGATGYQGVIPPNKDVVFELELVNFTPAGQ